MSGISNTCVCGVTTITRTLDLYGEVGWSIEDIHNIRKECELSKWEDHEAEAFLEVNDTSLSEIMILPGREYVMDLLQENKDIQEIKDGWE